MLILLSHLLIYSFGKDIIKKGKNCRQRYPWWCHLLCEAFCLKIQIPGGKRFCDQKKKIWFKKFPLHKQGFSDSREKFLLWRHVALQQLLPCSCTAPLALHLVHVSAIMFILLTQLLMYSFAFKVGALRDCVKSKLWSYCTATLPAILLVSTLLPQSIKKEIYSWYCMGRRRK